MAVPNPIPHDGLDMTTDVPVLSAPREGVPPVLSTPRQFSSAAATIESAQGPIALDTERASGFTYSARAYLVQLRREGAGSFLIDPIAHPEAVAPITVSVNRAEWILHAADQDLPSLRELGFECAELFDTELAGRFLGLPRVNLATMCAQLLGSGLAKGHGAADWSTRPLPDSWLNYAALDVELLIPLREECERRLQESNKIDWAIEEFEYIRTKPPSPPRSEPWRRLSGLHAVKDPLSLAVARALWISRDDLAARRNVAPGRILPDSAIIAAATKKPTTIAQLRGLPVFSGPRQRNYARRWLSAIAEGLDTPRSQLPRLSAKVSGPPPHKTWAKKAPLAHAYLTAARQHLVELSNHHNIAPEILLAPDALRTMCWNLAAQQLKVTEGQINALLADTGARNWQRQLTVIGITEKLKELTH